MSLFKRDEPEVLPGAEAEKDCQTPVNDVADSSLHLDDGDHDDDHDHEHDVTWAALSDRGRGEDAASLMDNWQPQRHAWALWLEKLALMVEKPVNKIAGTHQLNPFYHTGTIAFFLLLIVGATGFYLFIFFQYGFEASYQAVTRLEGQPIARLMRAVHRYASGALVVTTLLHAYRTLFMERFRGARWLAWVTGIVLTVIMWLAGVTGYWLLWDQRAQLITDSFVGFLDRFTSLTPSFMAWMRQAELSRVSWPILFLILAIHVLLFLISIGFFYLHIRRLSRPKWLPEMQWTVSLVVVLIVVSAVFPAGLLPAASNTAVPAQITLDPIFLFFLPTVGKPTAIWLWAGLAVVTLVSVALPWISRDKKELPKVHIIKDRCTGCTKCALDCPYGAIQMVERHDGKPHKFIAIEDPSLCVSCGICVGSCDGVAVGMGDIPPDFMWETVAMRLRLAAAKAADGQVKVIYTCERHAQHGARPYLRNGEAGQTAVLDNIEIITLPCVGAAPPDLLKRTLDAGAAEVQVVGCPPEDCSNREGNVWTEKRLTRQRVPRLRREAAQAPITALWLAPNEFNQALKPQNIPVIENEDGSQTVDYLSSRRMTEPLNWRHYLVAFGMLAVVMVVQILTTDLPYSPLNPQQAHVKVILENPAAPFGRLKRLDPIDETFVLTLTVDEEVMWQRPLQADDLFILDPQPFFEDVVISPGSHTLRLAYINPATGAEYVLHDESLLVAAGDIITLAHVYDKVTFERGDEILR